MRPAALCLALSLTALSACAEEATLPEQFGPSPTLAKPVTGLIPTVNIADAVGWGRDGQPTPAPGFKVTALARGLEHPRWLHALPNGDVLVAESNAPADRPKEKEGVVPKVMGMVMAKAGAGVESPNKIVLLRDADGDGLAEVQTTFMQGLNSPFGMALVKDTLYIANTDAIVKVPYKTGQTSITAKPTFVTDLPAGPYNHHWTKNIIASGDGKKLYATVGSNSNVAERGMAIEEGRAAIYEVDPATGDKRLFATGLRNPVGLAWQPQSGELWTAVNERDELGSDLVPDYMTSVKRGAFYGWPYSYYGQHADARVSPQNPDMVAKAIPPDYALGAHTASLGLAFDTGGLFPARYKNGAFIGQHGSWNRSPKAGYRVLFVPFENGKPSGMPEEILGGFLGKDGGEALGRPVGVAFDKQGALLVADDVGNAVWRVTPIR